MARLIVVTDDGEEVREIETYVGFGRGFTPRCRYSLDFMALTEAMDEAHRRENAAAMLREATPTNPTKENAMTPACTACGAYLMPCAATATGIHPGYTKGGEPWTP